MSAAATVPGAAIDSLVPSPTVATLRHCDEKGGDPGQGWHWEQGKGFLLSNGRNGNSSAPNWKLPNCGWCLAVGSRSVEPIGASSVLDANAVHKAHCCAKGTCLHHPAPGAMCTNVSSTVAARFKVLSDGRLSIEGSEKCIGAANATPGLTVGALECNQKGATFIAWRPNMRPSLRATTALDLCLGTGAIPGARPMFHCNGDRCVPGGDSHVSYLDPDCFSQCNSTATLGVGRHTPEHDKRDHHNGFV